MVIYMAKRFAYQSRRMEEVKHQRINLGRIKSEAW
jgi:hypothetical protein